MATTGADMERGDVAIGTAIAGIILAGAIFGFFYAWVCSTMWGLDDVDPRAAIEAMQGMNASVRNPVFFPAFFLTPFALAAAAFVARGVSGRAAVLLAAAAAVYLVGGLILTMTVNVPMNDDLAAKAVPAGVEEARRIWEDYSPRWQAFNQARTGASGASLLLAVLGLVSLARGR